MNIRSNIVQAQSWGQEIVCEDEFGKYASYTGSCEQGKVCACDECKQQKDCDAYYCNNINCPSNITYCTCPTCGTLYNCSSGSHTCSTQPGGGGGGGDNNNNNSRDCNGVLGGVAYYDFCGKCVGGTTGKQPCKIDCAGVRNGTAYYDSCFDCVGGTTGKQPCVRDCNGTKNGTAYIDDCGECVGGTTIGLRAAKEPCEESYCNPNSPAYDPSKCTRQCIAFKVLWDLSFKKGMKETGAYILDDGSFHILDNTNNGTYVTKWTGGLSLKDNNGNPISGRFIERDGEYLRIVGIVHTHVDRFHTEGPTTSNDDRDDWNPLDQIGGRLAPGQIYGLVISNEMVYKYYYDYQGYRQIVEYGFRNKLQICD